MKAIRIVLACLRKADETYNLINDKDKIVLGLSGGKDSVALLYALHLYQKFSNKKFIVQPVTLDLGFDGFNGEILKNYCASLGYELIIYDAKDVYKILSANQKANNLKHLPCSICSKMKKAAINKVANDLGYKKVAFAHHADDAIETLLMNMTTGGRIATFSPKMHLERADITFIRPLINAYEKDIERLVKEENLPVLGKICPSDRLTNRENIKNILSSFYKQYKGSHENFLLMLSNYEKEDLFTKTISYQIDGKGLCLKPVIYDKDKAEEIKIRTDVFVKEQGIDIKDELVLEEEKEATSFLIIKNNKTIGTIRYLKIDDNNYKIGRFAIIKKYRNKGIGEKVLSYLTKYILKRFYPENILIHAQYKSKNVYLKAGYKIISKPFIEAKIKHVKMIYNKQKK